MQEWLWIPAMEKLRKSVKPPLRILCLPGRGCQFLIRLFERGLTTLDAATCVERDKVEALLIRGALARYAGQGVPKVDLIQKPVLAFLRDEERAVERRYHVIDLDPYGRLSVEGGELLNSVEAALDVQVRANVSDWLLLLQTEVASARGGNLVTSLGEAERIMMDAAGDHVRRHLSGARLTEPTPPARLLRYSGCVGAWIAETAYPRFEAEVFDRPMFYRGSNEYGIPSQRALMGGFAVRFRRPRAATGSLSPAARRKKIEPVADACITRCLKAKAVVAMRNGTVCSGPLDALTF